MRGQAVPPVHLHPVDSEAVGMHEVIRSAHPIGTRAALLGECEVVRVITADFAGTDAAEPVPQRGQLCSHVRRHIQHPNPGRLHGELCAEPRQTAIQHSRALVRRDAVTDVLVDATLRCVQRGQWFSTLVDVVVHGLDDPAHQSLAPMRRGGTDPRHPAHRHGGTAWKRDIEGVGAGHAHDLGRAPRLALHRDPKARPVDQRQSACDLFRRVGGAESPPVGKEDRRPVFLLDLADLDAHRESLPRMRWPPAGSFHP